MLTADQHREAEFGYTLAESKRGFEIPRNRLRARDDGADRPKHASDCDYGR
jgi:hypothetical protein